MSNLDRVFKISDGLTHIAGKKIKAAVDELKKEGVVTPSEAGKILSGMSKAKKNIYDALSKELKKVLAKTKASMPKTKGKKKRE